jgi:hypothetical protein
MTEQSYSYPDKLGFGETLMFHIRVMSHELATDGLKNEFEDLVDMAGWLIWPYLKEDGKDEKWNEIAKDDIEVQKPDDPLRWGKAKRRRCEGKMHLIMGAMHKNGLLLKRVKSFDPDLEYYSDISGDNEDG